jgi:2-dehydropantoate 2-reductase
MGAVGSLVAATIISKGEKIVGLCRGKQFDAIQSHGLTFVTLEGKEQIIPTGKNFQVFMDFNDPKCRFNDIQQEDWVFISSKVYSLDSLLRKYSKEISQNGKLVLVQNGIGNEDLVHDRLPNVRAYRMLTTNGALLESPGRVRHTGPGYTKFGYSKSNHVLEDREISDALVNLCDEHPLYATYEPNMDVLMWEKIFVNIGINAIASINNIPNGGLVESEELKDLMKNAITEAWEVARALNVQVDSTPTRYIEFTYAVCEKTKPNRNSMLQDLDRGRKTEVDFINGKIVEYGRKNGISTPINQELTQKIKNFETK